MSELKHKYPNVKENQITNDEALQNYMETMTKNGPDLLDELVDETMETMHNPGKMAGKIVGRTLKMLASMINAKSCLELGMFTGFTALSIAEGMPEDGKLICLEASPLATDTAKKYFAKSEHGNKIEVKLGMIEDTLPECEGPFDIIFLDADKRNYLNYFKELHSRLRVGGLFIIDNALWMGHVMDPKTPLDKSVAELNQAVVDHPDYENVFFAVRDGLNIARKIR